MKFRRFFIGPAVIAVLLYYSNGGYLRLTEIDRHLKKKKYFPRVSIHIVYILPYNENQIQHLTHNANQHQTKPSISIPTPEHQHQQHHPTIPITHDTASYFKTSSMTFCTASASPSNSSLRLISRSSSPSVSSFPKSQISFIARVRERMSSAARIYASTCD